MTSPDDEEGEMRRFSLSDPEALLSGKLSPEDAPPELAKVAGLIQAARAPASARELAGEDHLVAVIAAEVRRSAPAEVVVDNRRRRLIGQALSAKVIAATAAVLLSGGVAAAATGSLPASVQRAVSHGLVHVGISVPDPAAHRSPVRSGVSASSNGQALAKSATGANRYGLCTAYLHPSKTTNATSARSSATAFSRLAATALAKGETIPQYCQGATPPSTTVGTNHGSTHRPTTTPHATGRPNGKSKPAHTTPVSAHRHQPKTIPTKPGRTTTTSVSKVHPSGSAHGTARSTATHGTTPAGKVRGGSSVKNSTTSTSSSPTSTTNLAGSVPGTSSASNNAGRGPHLLTHIDDS